MAVRARPFREERLDAFHALLVLDLREGIFDGVDGIVICEIHLACRIRLLIVVKQMILFRWAMEHEVFFLVREVAERDIRADADMVARDVFHERPHEPLPRQDSALVNREGVVRHEFCFIDRPHDARPLARATGTAAVKCEVFRAGAIEMRTARRADELKVRCDVHRRRHPVPVRAAVAREAGEHEAQAVQELRHRAERAADAGDARPLTERERRRDIADGADIGDSRLRHAPPRVRRERFGIEHAERERGFPRARDAGDADNFMERDVDVDVLQVMHLRTAYLDMVWLFDAHGRASFQRKSSSMQL